jgi:hypothetical protein
MRKKPTETKEKCPNNLFLLITIPSLFIIHKKRKSGFWLANEKKSHVAGALAKGFFY